jgi:hypothetical protein
MKKHNNHNNPLRYSYVEATLDSDDGANLQITPGCVGPKVGEEHHFDPGTCFPSDKNLEKFTAGKGSEGALMIEVIKDSNLNLLVLNEMIRN